MALQSSTKTKLALVLGMLRDDVKLSMAVRAQARHRLTGTDVTDAQSVAPLDTLGARDATKTSTLDAIIADIAAN